MTSAANFSFFCSSNPLLIASDVLSLALPVNHHGNPIAGRHDLGNRLASADGRVPHRPHQLGENESFFDSPNGLFSTRLPQLVNLSARRIALPAEGRNQQLSS